MDLQKRRVWRDNEIKSLLKSWKDHVHLKRLAKKSYDKNPLYFQLSRDLRKDGYNRSMREVMFKLDNLQRYHRRAKFGQINGNFITRWFDQVDEILKLEKSIHGGNQVAESETEQTMELTPNSSLIQGSIPELNKELLVRTNITDDGKDSESDLLSYTIIEPTESEVPNNSQVIQVSVPQLSSCNFQNTTDNILLKFSREFQRSNRQLEANDAAMLEIFKQQNEIFRTQTTLLMKLLLK